MFNGKGSGIGVASANAEEILAHYSSYFYGDFSGKAFSISGSKAPLFCQWHRPRHLQDHNPEAQDDPPEKKSRRPPELNPI